MFDRVLKFFIDNARINYLLFVLIFIVGIYSYVKTPKEIFPSFELDMVSIRGGYTGASIDILDRMAVKELEDEVKNIDGISSMATTITPGKFSIYLELEKRVDKYATADKVKDAVAIAQQNLPNDMDEPIVRVLEMRRVLLNIALLSKGVTHDELIKKSEDLKDKLSSIKNVTEVIIYGNSDIYFDIKINTNKLKALNLDEKLVANSISKLSYIFPIGMIEDSTKGHYYISTFNGKKDALSMENTLLQIGDKKVYLKDIATIKKRYADASTMYSVDTKNAIDVSVKQSEEGNAIEIAKEIDKLVKELNKNEKKISYVIHNDHSTSIKDRLNIIVSNILLGITLIALLVMLLINTRMSFVITLGIPTSFVMGAFYLYISGYSINMISLVGVLIALGIIVDDAIVVSENIQQHLEEGKSPRDAAMQGASEMFKPVTIASITTLFAFIPSLMMSGTMGEVIKLIPIAVSVLVLASLVESFIFLPIHAAHLLKKDSPVQSWERVNRIYSKIIHLFIKFRKTSLLLFIVLIPLLIVLGIKASKFQMFPTFDASSVNISLKADVNTKVEDTDKILKLIEQDIYENKDRFYIDHVGAVAGWRIDGAMKSENYPYVGMLTLELHKLKAQNFVDKFITPYLSFYYDSEGRTREKTSLVLSKELREFLKEKKYKERFNLNDLSVVEKKVGPIKSDLAIGLISDNDQKVIHYIKKLKEQLYKIDGIVSVLEGTKFGIAEIKLEINSYGESLGLDERTLGMLLSDMYLEKKKSVLFDETQMLEIKIASENKDSLQSLKNYELHLQNGTIVLLKDVAIFHKIKSFEKVVKDFGEKNFYIYANVDTDKITATQALKKIQPLLDKIKGDGIKLKFKGEKEKQKELKSDMQAASTLALILIMISLLYMFNSFSETFMMMSVIPFSFLGVIAGHFIMGVNLSMPSIIGMLGLSGVVINDGIIMVMNLKKAKNIEEIFFYASKRFRPIILTSVTTLIGLSSLIFFPTGQAAIFQPMAIALGFGLAWGTILNLLYLPVLFTIINRKKLM